MKQQNIFHSLRFDGHILKYKPSVFLKGTRFIEMPINVVLDYKVTTRPFIRAIKLIVNKYHYDQTKPDLLALPQLLLIGVGEQQLASLLNALDKTIIDNLQGKNIGVYHLKTETLVEYYIKQRAMSSKMASTRILNENLKVLERIEEEHATKLIDLSFNKMAS